MISFLFLWKGFVVGTVKCDAPSVEKLYLLSQGEIQALFLRHEGYLCAIGAFLKGAEEEGEMIFHF